MNQSHVFESNTHISIYYSQIVVCNEPNAFKNFKANVVREIFSKVPSNTTLLCRNGSKKQNIRSLSPLHELGVYIRQNGKTNAKTNATQNISEWTHQAGKTMRKVMSRVYL